MNFQLDQGALRKLGQWFNAAQEEFYAEQPRDDHGRFAGGEGGGASGGSAPEHSPAMQALAEKVATRNAEKARAEVEAEKKGLENLKKMGMSEGDPGHGDYMKSAQENIDRLEKVAAEKEQILADAKGTAQPKDMPAQATAETWKTAEKVPMSKLKAGDHYINEMGHVHKITSGPFQTHKGYYRAEAKNLKTGAPATLNVHGTQPIRRVSQ